MRTTRLSGLVLLAVMTAGVVGVSPAGASSPEFRMLPSVKSFTSTGGLSILRGRTSTMTCSAHTTKGAITSMDSVGRLVVTFNGCVVATSSCSAKAKSVTGKEGEIVTNLLKGELGTVKTTEATSGVGMLFTPATGTKFLTFAANSCLPESTTNGSLAGEATPANKLQKTGKFVLTAFNGNNTELIKRIWVLGKEEEPELEAFGALASAETTDQGTYAEPIEIT